MQTMETTTRELSISTMVGLTLQSLHSKHPLRYSDTCSQARIPTFVIYSTKAGELRPGRRTKKEYMRART